MLEEEAPVTPDTPVVEPDTPEIPWQKRYEDLRPEFDRTTQALKDEQAAWEDEQAVLARIAEKHPHLLADEEPEPDPADDDEPEAMTRAEFKEWETAQQAKETARESERQFNTDLKKFVADRELPEQGLAWILSKTHKSPEELQASVDGWFTYEDSLRSSGKSKKKPAHVLPGGKTVTGVPDYSEMTRSERDQAMVDRARAVETQ